MPDLNSYTESVIAAIGEKASPRVKTALPILIKHLHAAVCSPSYSRRARDDKLTGIVENRSSRQN